METFQENLEHQKRGKGRKRQQTDRIAPRDGLARPPVGRRSRRRDNEVVRSNGPGNGPRDSGSAARPRPSAARCRAHEGRRTCPRSEAHEGRRTCRTCRRSEGCHRARAWPAARARGGGRRCEPLLVMKLTLVSASARVIKRARPRNSVKTRVGPGSRIIMRLAHPV